MPGLLRIPTVTPVLALAVYARPRPQGSKRGMVNAHTGKVVMRESSSGVKQFRTDVRTEAAAALPAGWTELDEPVTVLAVFSFPRPAGHFGTGRNAGRLKPSAPRYPISKQLGDTEKLARAVQDALDSAGVFRDDSRTVELHAAKRYAGGPGELALPRPGVLVRVWRTVDLEAVAA